MNTTNTTITTTNNIIPKGLMFSLIILLPLPCAYMNTYYSLMLVYALVEILFYINFNIQKRKLQAMTQPAHPLTLAQRKSLFWNCVHTIKDVSSWSEGWFYYKKDHSHPSFKDIKRDNMALWFAWAFWHDNLDTVMENPEWAMEMEWMLSTAEQWYGIQFPRGFNAELECIRLNLDPVEAFHRPLVVYLALYAITSVFNVGFLGCLWNFQRSAHVASGVTWGNIMGVLEDTMYPKSSAHKSRISYYYRPGNHHTPLVFIHGIGAGVICYAEFIHQLVKSQLDRPIFLVELPYVAMHMVDQVPTAKETVAEMTTMLQSHGYERAVFISHSLGTGVTSWIMNINPSIIGGLVLIDPICFLLHYHHVAFNFVHRIPKTLVEYIMHYGAARELYISNYISRHFQWFETIYFTKEKTDTCLSNAAIFLSENDGIVGSASVHQYLLSRGIETQVMNQLEHAMFLTNKEWKNVILKQIDQIATNADKV